MISKSVKQYQEIAGAGRRSPDPFDPIIILCYIHKLIENSGIAMRIDISASDLTKKLLGLILALLALNVIGFISKLYIGPIYGLLGLFSFDAENNIPTLYSAFAMTFASGLLAVIALTHKRNGASSFAWFGLAVIFLFLAVDEVASIHEKLSAPLRETLNTSGLLYYAWVIPYGVATLVFVITYLKFWLNLPGRVRMLFAFAGLTFAAGAVGFELFGGRHAELYGKENLAYSLLYTCEEFLEMVGIVIFLNALVTYITSKFQSLTVSFSESKVTNIADG